MTEINVLNQIAARDQERIRGYRELLEFYQGKHWPGRERWGEKRLTFNYARVFIDKITSYLMSGVNFTVEAVQDTPEACNRAEQAEKILAEVYEANNLEQLDFETEIDCAILGDACYKVTWEEGGANSLKLRAAGGRRVKVTSPDIQGDYAWHMGDDLSRVWRVASRYSLTSEEVESVYGREFKSQNIKMPGPSSFLNPESYSVNQTSSLHAVIELWTDPEFELYIDNSLIEKKPNPYGFIPFVIFPNLREPKKFWGTSDLINIMEPQRELNRAMSQISHILELSGNPVAVLENVEESTDIAVKPGAVWNIPEDAKAYLLDLLQGGGLDLHIKYIDLLYRTLHDLSESPRAAFGGMDRDLSGTAMQIELYPLLQKVLRKRAIRTSVYNQRNRMILKLIDKFSGKRLQHSTVSSQPSPLNPRLNSDSSMLRADDLRLRVVWGQVMPQDKAKLVSNEQILVQEGIHSRRRAMDEVGIKDPEAEFKRWLEERGRITQISG
jgi:hypothetical protein